MRLLISQCKNSTLCCFEKYIARPFIKGEDKFKVVSCKNTLLVPLLRRKARLSGRKWEAIIYRTLSVKTMNK